MDIIYFHQHFSTPKGSAGIRSYQMARALIKQGHRVTIVCGSYQGGSSGLSVPFVGGERRGSIDRIQIIEFNLLYANTDSFFKRSILFLKFAFKSIKLVFTEQYDLVFATSTPLTAGIPGIFAFFLRRKKFIFEVRDLWPELPKAMGVITNPVILAMMFLLEWVTYHSAYRIVGLAPGIVQGIIHRGIAKEKIALIPNGCDLSLFTKDLLPWRPEVVDENDFLAVFTGTHGIANGLDAVLDVALLLQQRGRNDIKILLIGQGREKAALEKRAQKDGITNVIFHEPVEKKCVAGLLAAADLGLQILANVPAFYYGTSPNKFFDYLSAKLPVLCNYPGWVADIIHKEQCGFVIPPESPVAFANALEKAADDRELLQQMGRNSLVLARREFDRDILAKQFIQWLEGGLCE